MTRLVLSIHASIHPFIALLLQRGGRAPDPPAAGPRGDPADAEAAGAAGAGGRPVREHSGLQR